MPDYRRWYLPGGTFFFTVVTDKRRPLFADDQSRVFLREAISKVRKKFDFLLVATVLLPDHWHLVMQLPQGENNYSIRIRRIKVEFTRRWLSAGNHETPVSAARSAKGERGVWQSRFWEHTVRDENDIERCCDYIHWNPVKHGLVHRVRDWPWSSFHRFVKLGQYEMNWGSGDPERNRTNRDWGE